MTRFVSLLAVSVSCLFVQQPVAFADDGFDLIPANASLVVRLNAPQSTLEDLAAFVNKVQPGVGGILSGQAGMLGMGIANPSLDGVFMNSDWYAAVFARPTGPPDVVWLIPSSDADEVKRSVNPGYKFAVKGQFIAYSQSVDRIQNVEACFSGDVAPVASLLDERQRKMMSSGHLTLLVNGGVLKSVFADQLERADDELAGLIDTIASQASVGNSQMDLTYVWDMYREFGRHVLQTVRDSEAFVISVEATENALQIDELLSVSTGSKTDAALLTQLPSDLATLTSVPQGQSIYFGAHGDMTPFMAYVERMMVNMPVDDKAREHFKDSFAVMKEVKFGSIVGGGDLLSADDSGMKYFGISEISPASKIREAFAGIGPGLEYEIAGLKQSQTYTPDAEEIDGLSVDLFQFKQTVPPELDPTGMQRAIQEKLYGPDGQTQRLVAKGDTLYQTMGGGIDGMNQLLSSEKWTDSKLLAARDRLPEQANLLCLVDIPSMIQRFAKLIISTGSVPVPLTEDQLSGLKIAPSYAGFSVTSEPQRVFVRSSIPVETLQGFAQIVFFVQQLQAGR